MIGTKDLDWKAIEAAAAEMGVGVWARKAWKKTRHVPYKWRYPLTQKISGLQMEDFGPVRAKAQ